MPIVTREQVRQILVTRVEATKATWTTYSLAIEYDNTNTVNRATQSLPFLCVSIVYQDGYQTTLGADSGERALGSIVIEAMVKEGTGTAKANALLEHFYRQVHKTDSMTPLRTLASRFGSAKVKDGWVSHAAIIPFWYDSLP